MPSPFRPRRFLTHALLAALLCAGAAPLAWIGYDRWQNQAKVRELTGDNTQRQAALGYLYAHAGDQPRLVGALCDALPGLPPEKAVDALRVAALSCANTGKTGAPMNPQVAKAAGPLLQRLEKNDGQLRLIAYLEKAAHDARRASRWSNTRAFDLELAKQVEHHIGFLLETRKTNHALRTLALFENLDPGHPAIKAGYGAYLAHLEKSAGTVLLEDVAQLNQRGKWGLTAQVPASDALYNRWLCALSGVKGEDTRRLAVSLIRARPQAGTYPELGDALLTLTQDGAPAVRLAALHAATEWVSPDGLKVAPAFAKAIFAATQDRNQAIAREAWTVLGLLPPAADAPTIPGDLEHLPSPVAEAAFATLVQTHPNDEKLLARLIALLKGGDTLAISATHALMQSPQPLAKQALAQLLAQPPGDAVHQLCQWRALLGASPKEAQTFLAQTNLPSPLANAATFAAAKAPANLQTKPADEAARQQQLAALEGLPPASATFENPKEDFGLAFLAMAKAEKDPERLIAHLRPLLLCEESVWRDLACLVAVERLDKPRLTELARDLLATVTDEAKMSGAMLCGLGNVRPKRIQGGSAQFLIEHPEWSEAKLYAQSDSELAKLGLSTLDALNDNANRWSDAKTKTEKGVLFTSQIGLALRHDRPGNIASFLFDNRVPYSTVLLGLLQQNRADALDMLLGDDVRVPFVPRQLLANWRFGETLAHFLPKTGPMAAPHIDYWGDIHLQNLQYERLRAWWRLRRQGQMEKK